MLQISRDWLSGGVKIQSFDFSNLTVVFITYNREEFLLRNLQHWSKTNAKIIVLDGSDNSIDNCLISQYPNIGYFYKPVSLEQRIYFVRNLIKTKYVMLAADDDFIFLSGADKCIKHLELNSDLIAVFGTALRSVSNNGTTYYETAYNNLLSVGQINQDSHWERARRHFYNKNYETSTFYSIRRTDSFINIASIFKDLPKFDGNMLELILEFCTVFLGKTSIINELTWLRTSDAAANWNTVNVVGKWTLLFFNRDRKIFLDRLDKYVLSKSSKLPSGIRKLLFLLIMTNKHLYDLTKIQNISRWLFLPVLITYIHLSNQIKPTIWIVKKIINIKQIFKNHLTKNYRLNPHSVMNTALPHKKHVDELKQIEKYIDQFRSTER